jgi:predicted HTH domain antitoxin
MSHVTVELDDDLAQVVGLLDRPLDQAVRELVVLELYRRSTISSGKAAELLGMSKLDFIQYSGRLGIPYFQMTDEEMDAEAARIRAL